MSRYLHKYKYTISRGVILFFLLTGNLSVWATTSLLQQTESPKSHCVEHVIEQDSNQDVYKQQHDCCKTQKTCNKSCCNFCVVNGVSGIALFTSINLPITYYRSDFVPTTLSLPDGVQPSNLYRPPQFLLI